MFLRKPEYFVDRFHEKQEEAWIGYQAGLDLVLDWGRRSGKSDFEAELFVEDIENHRKDCLFVAITQGQAREILWPKLLARLANDPDWKLREHKMEAHYWHGGVLSLKGADKGPDHLRGSGKRLIGCDEFAFWRNPDLIVNEVLTPMLADYNGQFVYTSTPKGKNHFWRLKRKASERPEEYFTNKCTMFDNPFIPQSGKDRIVETYRDEPNIYRQEILGEYVDFEGMVFAISQERYVEDCWPLGELDHCYHFRGLDHGYSPDPTACIWLAYHPRRDQWMVYSEYRKKESLLAEHAKNINGKHDSYAYFGSYSDIDPQIIAEMNALGLECSAATKYNKEARILQVLQMLRSGKLKIAKNCVKLLEEMMTYEWGQDGDDHCIDALVYVCTNATLPVPKQPEPEYEEEPYRREMRGFDPMSAYSDANGQDFGD